MKIKNLVLSSAAALALFAVTTTAADAATVTVKAGDTVAEIANTYNTTVNAIRDANNLSNVNLIFVGDQLEVGGNTAVASTPVVSSPVATTTTTNTTVAAAPKATVTSSSNSSSYVAPKQTTTESANTNSAAAAPKATVASSNNSSSYVAPKQTTTTAAAKPATTVTYTSNNSSSENDAKAWIAGRESGGSYTVTNGQYVGKYQLSSSYLNGDYSAANQEKVADSYVSARYGSWAAAKAHSQATGWY